MNDRSRGDRAADRADEIQHLLSRLRAGEHLTADDLDLAKQRVRSAHVSAAEAHERAAEAHDRAAIVIPDEARDNDYRAAEDEEA